MGLYRRGAVWHYEFRHKGQRHRFSTGCARKADAARFAERERRRIALGLDDAPGLTLADAATSWWTTRGELLRSAKTIAFQLEIARRHLDFGLDISAITTADIASAMTRRRGDVTHNRRRPRPRP